MRADTVDECGIPSGRATLNIKVDAVIPVRTGVTVTACNSPVQNSVAEGSCGAAAAQEHVPNLVCKAFALVI